MPKPLPKFILASASPRRAEILRALGIDFDVVVGAVCEGGRSGEGPAEYVVRIACAKAASVAASVTDGIIIGADTTVVIDGRMLGKPRDAEDARAMLGLLNGRWHAVMTGVALRDAATGQEVSGYEKTLVRFGEMSEQEIAAYVASGEPLDKAGAYAIQGRGALFVEEIAGNYYNVVGFPPTLFARLARRLDADVLAR